MKFHEKNVAKFFQVYLSLYDIQMYTNTLKEITITETGSTRRKSAARITFESNLKTRKPKLNKIWLEAKMVLRIKNVSTGKM